MIHHWDCATHQGYACNCYASPPVDILDAEAFAPSHDKANAQRESSRRDPVYYQPEYLIDPEQT